MMFMDKWLLLLKFYLSMNIYTFLSVKPYGYERSQISFPDFLTDIAVAPLLSKYYYNIMP